MRRKMELEDNILDATFSVEVNADGKPCFRHLDRLAPLRWPTRVCVQILDTRPWNAVSEFYRDVVLDNASISDLVLATVDKTADKAPPVVDPASEYISEGLHGEEGSQDFLHDGSAELAASRGRVIEVQDIKLQEKKESKKNIGKLERTTFKIVLAYFGAEFQGWQSQPELKTVQGTLQSVLGKFVDNKRPSKEATSSDPGVTAPLALVSVAGRTDKGVSALGQVCSFYTWKKNVATGEVMDAINSALPGQIRARQVSVVPRSFHPIFSACWRHYMYLLPLNDGEGGPAANSTEWEYPAGIHVAACDWLLRSLEARSLDFSVFARDTKSDRSSGPATLCQLYRARASLILLPNQQNKAKPPRRAMMVDLIGDRFLRRMVRVLVSTAVREAAAGAGPHGLLRLIEIGDRRSTAPPAPPQGLCLVKVGYSADRPC